MKILSIFMIILFVSCSVTKEDDDSSSVVSRQHQLPDNTDIRDDELRKLDSDGDYVSDYDELIGGTSVKVGNYPQVKTKFLQNFKISCELSPVATIDLFDLQKYLGDYDYEYRVGELFLRRNSLLNAARIGRFSGHSSGVIKQRDLSWVSYPDFDSRMIHNLRRSGKIDCENTYSVEVTSKITLLPSKRFKSIEDIEISYFYYNYETEKYEKIEHYKHSGVFLPNQTENIKHIIRDVPRSLIIDNFLNKSEFIIAEITDFYIPEYKMDWSQLKKSMLGKTIPVYVSTPLNNKVVFAALDKGGSKFVDILSDIFPEQFEMKSNKLHKIDQFTNQFSDIEYLLDIGLEDKKGNWFVMTQDIQDSYFKHIYKLGESISLIYATGRELAMQRSNKRSVTSKPEKVVLEDKEIPLGGVEKNSSLNISLFAHYKEIKKPRVVGYEPYIYSPTCSGNCSGCRPSIVGRLSYHDYEIENLSIATDEVPLLEKEVFSKIFIKSGNTSVSLLELMSKDLGIVKIIDSGKFFGGRERLDISIGNLSKIFEINNGDELLVSILVKPTLQEEREVGLSLDAYSDSKNCSSDENTFHRILANSMNRYSMPFISTSKNLKNYAGNIPYGQRTPNNWVIQRAPTYIPYESLEFSVESTIINYYN